MITRSDIPFASDESHAFLPWVIGIMVCLATLLLCLGVTANGWIGSRHATYVNSFTVNIPADTADLGDKLPKVRTLLEKMPDVTSVTQVSEKKLKDMLKPWLGNSEAIEALPLPVVLDVSIDKAADVDYRALQKNLSAIIPGIEIDGHERWVTSFSNFSSAMRALIMMLAVLIVTSLALMIAFTSRASLRLHAKTVQLLHSIGADDEYIMRQFQSEAFLLTLRGTVPGCLLAGLVYWLAGSYMISLQSSVLPSLSMSLSHLALILLMPLACGSVAWASARFSVLRQLQASL